MPYRRSRLQDYYEQLLGGKPEEPESEEPNQDLPPYIYPSVPPRPQPAPPPIPQPQPESPHKYADQPVSQPSAQPTPPAEQPSGQASSSESSERGSAGSSQSEDAPDADHGKDETGAQEVLLDFEEAEENRIDPADIKFYLAARHNPVLKELRLICQQEKIPSPWKDRPDLLLWLCAEYGIDEENDAEAKTFLEHIEHGSSSYQNTDDPLNAAWQETLTSYEMSKADEQNEGAKAAFNSKLEVYTALVEDTFGVEFTYDESDPSKDTSWDLLGIRMAHVAFEKMAKALGIATRNYFNLDWDDATAFRRTIGKVEIHNSIDPIPRNPDGTIKGIAQVEVDRIRIYWNEKEGRNAYIIPNAMLHELGHILNANGAFGVDQFKAWFNFLEDYPESRKGMGAPAEDVLIGKKAIYNYLSEIILPTLAQDIGIWDPDHVIFDDLPDWFPRQIQSYQQSTDKTNNEKTADAIVNWVKHLITGGRFGFTSDEKGLNWQRIMDGHMDEVIRNANVNNMMPNDGPIDISHLGGYPRIYGLATVRAPITLNARSTPINLEDGSNIITRFRDGQRLAVLGRSEDGAWIATERYGALAWAFRGTEKEPFLILPVDLNIEDLPVYKDATLGLDP